MPQRVATISLLTSGPRNRSQLWAEARITCLDSSASMLEKAKVEHQKLSEEEKKVGVQHAPPSVLSIRLPNHFALSGWSRVEDHVCPQRSAELAARG